MFSRFLGVIAGIIGALPIRALRAYDELHSAAMNTIFMALGLSLIALPLNYFDAMRWINGVIGIFAAIMVASIATSPRLALLLLGSGAVASPSTPRAGIATVAEVWARFVGTVVLYLSVFFLVASTIEFSRNWAVLPALYLALIIIFLVGPLWGWQTRWAKPLVYCYTLVVLIVGFGSMISGATYVQWFGLDPYAYLGTSPVSEKLYSIQQLQQTQEQAETIKQLDLIQQKIKAGGKLSSDEQAFLHSLSVADSVAQKTSTVLESAKSTIGGWKDSLFSSVPLDKKAEVKTEASKNDKDKKVMSFKFAAGETIITGVEVKPGDLYFIDPSVPVRTQCPQEVGGFRVIDKPMQQMCLASGTLVFYAGEKGGSLKLSML